MGANTVIGEDLAFALCLVLTGTYLVATKTQTYKNARAQANRGDFS